MNFGMNSGFTSISVLNCPLEDGLGDGIGDGLGPRLRDGRDQGLAHGKLAAAAADGLHCSETSHS